MKLTNRLYHCKDCSSYAFPVNTSDGGYGVSCFGCGNRIEMVHHSKESAGKAWNEIHKPSEEIKEDLDKNIEGKSLTERFRDEQLHSSEKESDGGETS